MRFTFSSFLAAVAVAHQVPLQADSDGLGQLHAHWMRAAVQALFNASPCPFQAFGTAIVNRTRSNGFGNLICTGINEVIQTGDPTLHGEVVAIKNCTAILTDPAGKYKLSPAEAQLAWSDLTLYTTGEACPMCATAIRWAGFKTYVYATSIERLIELGWHQATITSKEIFDRSSAMGPATELVADVLADVTEPLLSWQFDPQQPCPAGCSRGSTGACGTG